MYRIQEFFPELRREVAKLILSFLSEDIPGGHGLTALPSEFGMQPLD